MRQGSIQKAIAMMLLASVAACGGGSSGNGTNDPIVPADVPRCAEPTLDHAVCNPASASFTLASTNSFYPLIPGSLTILEGEDEGDTVRVERRVLAETEIVAGIETHVLEHQEWVDGELEEIARNFYVEATDGTVCYFGEDVDFFEDGELVGSEGEWRAGIDGAQPGIIMPATPTVGQIYFQEVDTANALDMGRVSGTGETMTIAGTSYTDVLTIQDADPLDEEDACTDERKVYVPVIGEIVDEGLELVSHSAVAQCFAPTLDHAACDPATASFTLSSTNPYYPLVVGNRTVLEGEDDDETLRIERTVLADTEVVAGVTTHVLEHREFVDGELHEIARNYYVETTGGTVCYFGEDVEFFEDGELVGTQGTWKAGINGALPGIIMPAAPAVGQAFYQEHSINDGALDMGRVSAIGGMATVNGMLFADVVTVLDSNPAESCAEEEEVKLFAAGVGEISDDGVDLIEFTPGA